MYHFGYSLHSFYRYIITIFSLFLLRISKENRSELIRNRNESLIDIKIFILCNSLIKMFLYCITFHTEIFKNSKEDYFILYATTRHIYICTYMYVWRADSRESQRHVHMCNSDNFLLYARINKLSMNCRPVLHYM